MKSGSVIIVIPLFRGMSEIQKYRKYGQGGLYGETTVCIPVSQQTKWNAIYTGVTSNLVKRVWEHKNHAVAGFTKKYRIEKLVWYEMHETMESAINREKAIKNWKRVWKINVIEAMNPLWRDLYSDVL